jgi:hypothetical protein
MDARDSFREMLRDQVGPALRKEGFAGSGANWRRRNDAGDWGVVNFQKSAYGSAHSVDFYINLALVVEPERQFSAWSKRLSPRCRVLQITCGGAGSIRRLGKANGASLVQPRVITFISAAKRLLSRSLAFSLIWIKSDSINTA